MQTLHLQIPDDLLIRRSKSQLEALAQEALLAKLSQQGEVSSGYAAEALGISRREFLDLLGHYRVSMFAEDTGPAEEASYG